ncbi:MAG TPA: glycosyltransferase family 4 protein [Elusimicrobiota bacterium]|nr:glycosyltransferase family 4 protein [Elusimicrobiota bacterium]
MNLLITSDSFFPEEPGGSARVPWEIARRLVQRGHRVQFLVRRAPDAPSFEDREGVKIISCRCRRQNILRSFWAARKAAQRITFPLDAVHIHHPFTGAAALLGGALRDLPKIYFFHSPWHQEYLIRKKFFKNPSPIEKLAAWARRRVESFALRRCDRILTLSQFMTNQLRSVHRVPAEKIDRISGAADIQRFSPRLSVPDARRALQWPLDKTLLLTVRNLEARMGLENLLEALRRLRATDPSLHLHIVGQGSLRPFLEEQARRLGLQNHVTFLGFVPDEALPLCYQAADIFVLPTRELEGFGLVTVEALASGCPVVATQVGGSAEILKPFDRSLMALGSSADDLLLPLQILLKNRGRWPQLRAECARYAAQKYSWDAVVGLVEKTTLALLKNP